MMTFVRERNGPDTERVTCTAEMQSASFGDVLAGWRDDETFREATIAMLATSFPAFFWEMPPLRQDAISRPYECMLLASAPLARRPTDKSDFADKLVAARSITVFDNLSGDATLLAPWPLPGVPTSAYGHIAAFARGAPRDQFHQLLRVIGALVSQKLSARSLWLSTAGLGVAWLHVRLDTRPKYYRWDPYRLV